MLRLVGGLRFLMIIAVIGCAALGLALLAHTAIDTVKLIGKAFDPDTGAKAGKVLAIGAIELIDRYLLAAVAVIASVGLCELFIDVRVPVPEWLRVDSLDALKDKLLHVIVVVITVVFVGQLAQAEGGPDIAYLGVAVAAVIGAVSVFLVLAKKAKR